MASEPHRHAPMWVWVLSLALLALLVWLVGQRVRERPHVEIGVIGGEETPAAATPTPAPTAVERAERADRPEEPTGGGGGEGVNSEIPVSPAPRR